MDRIQCMQSFVRVAESGGFTAVAEELQITQSTVSKRVAALESHLGVKLLQRSTRQVVVTDEGSRYYAECREILERIDACESGLGRQSSPSGILRLTCPTALSHLQIFPRLRGFMDRYPDLRVSINVTDRNVDLIEEGVDVGIRVGDLDDSALIARRIGTARRVVVATPEYLTRVGEPQVPKDLADYDCLSNFKIWTFSNENRKDSISIPVIGRLSSNSPTGIREAVLSGLGIAMSPIWIYGNDIAEGRLVTILDKYLPTPLPIHAIYPSRQYLPPKVSAFIEYLTDEFSVSPWVSGYGQMDGNPRALSISNGKLTPPRKV